jgi:hypothetical protein
MVLNNKLGVAALRKRAAPFYIGPAQIGGRRICENSSRLLYY